MRKLLKLLGAVAIAAVIGVCFTACDEEVDEDYVTMQELNFINNKSSYDLKVNIEDKNGSKYQSLTIKAGSSFTNYSVLTPPITITYSPASKVKTNLWQTSVNFSNK